MIRRFTLRQLSYGERFPFGWGMAWQCWDRDACVIMPIPLNVIANWSRWVWFGLMHQWHLTDAVEKAERAGFDRGYESGKAQGLIQGKREGEASVYTRMLADLDSGKFR